MGKSLIVVVVVIAIGAEAEEGKQVSQQGLDCVTGCKTTRCASFVVLKKVMSGICLRVANEQVCYHDARKLVIEQLI